MFGTIKRRKSDILFSQYLRATVGKCEICGKKENLECSHFHGRRKESVRFDLENCDCLCNYHHRYFEENPADYSSWKFKKLGKRKYDMLQIRANTYCKKDEKLLIIYWKEMLKTI